jgi:ferredoxin
MERKIVKIDGQKCLGCGLCARACHESAIEIVGGKARLIRDDYCDGLGNCLPHCPAGAIGFETREAAAYDALAVKENQAAKKRLLTNWPIQIKLTPVTAPCFENSSILVAADCTAFAYGGFAEFLKGGAALIGCPKLDGVDYSEKLTEIIKGNKIKDIAVVKMEVPCCGGLEYAVRQAIKRSGKNIPCKVTTITIDGEEKAQVT